jgi:hypothetical protein
MSAAPDPGKAGAGGSHACAFFDSADGEYRVLLPFTRQCLACGEQCVHFIDPAHAQQRLERLEQHIGKADAAVASGQLKLRTWEESTLRGRSFNPQKMLGLIHALVHEHASFPRTRLWANMEWSLSGLPGCEQLVEFESRLNTVLDASGDLVVCVYDVRRYGASLVMDVLCTHPLVMVRGALRPNPLYVPTERFLADYQQRRAGAAS